MLIKRVLLAAFCSLVFPICPLLYGQASGSFSGTVTDKTGSVVTGASVKATVQGTGVTARVDNRRQRTLRDAFAADRDYTIRVDSQGFGPVEQKDVRLQVDEHRELDFTLTPASVTQTVEVSATEVAVRNHESDSGAGHYRTAGGPAYL